jgi:glycine/D-amino acid oxidase-like deaminating enzyme
MGWSTALFLKRLGYSGRVLVIERGGEDFSSTSRSVGGIRFHFSNKENIELSKFGAQYVKSLPMDVGFQERGYLWLASQDGAVDLLQSSSVLQRELDCDVSVLTPEEMEARWPYMQMEGVKMGSYGESGEGWLDPHLLRQSFATQAQELGVEKLKATVTKGLLSDGEVTGVELQDGSTVGCEVLVNALGPSCADLMVSMDPAFNLPVSRMKRNVFFFNCQTELPNFPMLINDDGVYVRPEGNGYICGGAENSAEDVYDTAPGDFDVVHSQWEETLWPSLATRVPVFECLKVVSSWAGHYEYNTHDVNAIIGKTPLAKNLYLINGFSGHGLQHSPGAGRAVAELITGGQFETIDLKRFCYDRILTGEKVLESEADFDKI